MRRGTVWRGAVAQHCRLTCVIISSAMLGLIAAATVADSGMATPPKQTVVVLGDSISAAYGIQREQGWVHLLDLHLQETHSEWRVVNASVSGETTSGGLGRLPGVLADIRPDIVIVELGGNDGLRGYPVATMQQNLVTMVDLIRAAGAEPIIVAMRIPPNYGPRYTNQFEAAFAEVAATKKTAFVPFLLAEVALEPGFMQDDGIHPTAAAQPTMLATLLPFLTPLL